MRSSLFEGNMEKKRKKTCMKAKMRDSKRTGIVTNEICYSLWTIVQK